jgi:hypothetical protein
MHIRMQNRGKKDSAPVSAPGGALYVQPTEGPGVCVIFPLRAFQRMLGCFLAA